MQFYAIQLALLRRLRRRPEDLAAAAASSASSPSSPSSYPAIPAWRCSLAATHAELGHRAEARAVFEPLAADDFATFRSTLSGRSRFRLLAETAASSATLSGPRTCTTCCCPTTGST